MINNKNPNNWGTSHLGRKEKIESKAAIETYPRNCLINEFRVNVKKCQTKDWAEQIKLSMIYRVHGIMSLPRVCLSACPPHWSVVVRRRIWMSCRIVNSFRVNTGDKMSIDGERESSRNSCCARWKIRISSSSRYQHVQCGPGDDDVDG